MNHRSAINGSTDTGLRLPPSTAGHFELETFPSITLLGQSSPYFRTCLWRPQHSAVAAAAREGRDVSEAAQEQGPTVVEIVDMVEKAAALADATRFIHNLPEGLGTIVGASGTRLSGGQRQRIAIARGLVKDPKGRTVISVAHRLSTIKKAGKIIVMSDGRVAEQGTYSELMEKHGTYSGFVELQNRNTRSAGQIVHDGASICLVKRRQRVMRSRRAVAGLSGSVIGTVLSIYTNLVAAIVLTFVVAWKIAILCLAIMPLLLGVGITQLRTLAKFKEKHEHAFTKSVGISVEAVDSIKTVAALSLEDAILAEYRRTLDRPRREAMAISFYASLWLALQYLIGNLTFGLAFAARGVGPDIQYQASVGDDLPLFRAQDAALEALHFSTYPLMLACSL
ncbi:ABC transporter transmembrane domain-containing protein [Hirsutella rhossiliensis]|uniref:ABC transporter transmembrane domain-containing protein n=1 Tax=Hirsutella rhossiliensis TaxID=111463 RepID=A0A9P8N0R4_9HYPO|nr:ABC transporter transmembrane domain-containing protein [Hirsutella rhossiliensis]KAH0964787.1 ABC transporter transmembrane domain-containing protein [Hirsutella rhossiliensis]